MATRSTRKRFVVCLRNKGYEVSLERRKIYQVLADPEAEKHKQIRVIDESGEDYLYPQNFFAPIKLPQTLRRAVQSAVYQRVGVRRLRRGAARPLQRGT